MGGEFWEWDAEQYEQKYREQQVKYLQKKAAKLGFQLAPA